MSKHALSDADVDRNKDYLYCVLTTPHTEDAIRMYKGIYQLVSGVTRHPCAKDVLSASHDSVLLQKALILLALNRDSSIQQHVIDHRCTCGDTVSQYLHDVLPAHVESFMQGRTSLDYFVCSAILDYVTI